MLKNFFIFWPKRFVLITTLRVVRISFVSILLYQVSFVRSDKGFDRVHCKTVGTSQDLARLLKHSQDFLGKPEEKVVSGEKSIETPRNNPAWRGKYQGPGENPARVHLSSVKDLKIPPIYYRALLSEDYTNRYQVEPHRADRRAIPKGSGSPAPPIGPMSRSPSRKRRFSTLKSMFDAFFVF